MMTCEERVPVPSHSFVKEYSEEDQYTLSLKFTSEPCSISRDNDTATKRALMSCGHAVDPASLTRWCRSLLDQHEYKLRCPAIVDGSNPSSVVKCNKVWPYEEVRRLALLKKDERMFFEAKLSENAAQEYCEMKECPGCRSYVERENPLNLRVTCLVCTRKKQKVYDFCWHCSEEWTGPTESSVKCGNPECELLDMQKIRDSPKINLLNGLIQKVPSRRACPNCGWVSEHTGEACKMRECRRCKIEFCFACLQFKRNCIQTGVDYFGICKLPVAPEQTSIPTWNRNRQPLTNTPIYANASQCAIL